MPQPVRTFAWRLIHRPIPILIMVFFIYQLEELIDWFMLLAEPTTQQAGFAGAVFTGIVGMFKFYLDTDKDDG